MTSESPFIVKTDNRVVYYKTKESSLYHREDGPAFLFRTRPKSTIFWTWLLDDILHCENGPAVYEADGTIMWYQNGKPHRLDGPAEITYNYNILKASYWIDGKHLSPKEFSDFHLVTHLKDYKPEDWLTLFTHWSRIDYSECFMVTIPVSLR